MTNWKTALVQSRVDLNSSCWGTELQEDFKNHIQISENMQLLLYWQRCEMSLDKSGVVYVYMHIGIYIF